MSAERRCAVFGATSYVGQFLLERLASRGTTLYAVTRSPAIADIFLRPLRDRITVCTPADLTGQSLDTVINLAYLKQSIPVGIVRRNRALVDAVHAVALEGRAATLVHVSSAAVFGYRLRRPPGPDPAPRLAGDSYFELKADAERWLLRRAKGAAYLPVIVRPGNVLGPGSPVWLAGPAQRILSGRPLALAGQDGFSNATYVRNLADYLVHLSETTRAALQAFGPYHHVAEFSATRWSRFFEAFAETVGVRPVYADALPTHAAAPLRPSLAAGAAAAYRGGPLGVWMRQILGRVPFYDLGNRMFLGLKTGLTAGALRAGYTADAADTNYLTIVSAGEEFRSHTLPTWQPPVSLETALREMRASLTNDGFAVAQPVGVHP